MDRRKHCRSFALLLLALNGASFAQDACRARIEIRIDAEIPNARDPSFITGLIANPQYRLAWVSGDSTRGVYDLTGPASDENCSSGIDQLRRDAAVLDVKVL